MNFTLCKNRSNYTKRNKQSRNPPLSVHSSQNRTIPRKSPTPLPYERFVGFAKCSKPPTPLPFNERSVGFASVQSLWAFNFGHPCPSLVKGSWIDGNAQTVALLLSACDMPTLFILQTFLLSRRRDCTPSAPSIRFSALSPSLFVGERLCVLSWLCVHCNRGRLRSVRPAPTFCDHL